MRFIDREREMRALNAFWKGKKPQLIVVYGKRRVGKTELIKQFIRKKPHIYFLAQKINEHENLKLLGETAGEYFKDDLLKRRGFESWKWVFEYLGKHVKKRLVFVIDEFPYLAEGNKAVSSIFQSGWDEYLKDTPVFFILCGSSIAMMEEEVLSYKAPLYGRRTGQIFLKPFPFLLLRKFYPRLSFERRLEFYSIAGGNPSYLLKLDPALSLDENLKENVLKPETFLYNEVEFILREELREPRIYFAILKAVAFGKHKISEIVNETGLQKGILHKYLFILEDLHLLKKDVPVTEKNPLKSRKGIYKLQDPFFRFWFRHILPNRGYLEEGRAGFVLNKIKKDFHVLLEGNFEDAAKEIVEKSSEHFFPISRIGRWWDRNEEIDVIGMNEDERKILFGEVKWSNKQVGVNIYLDLKRKAQLVDWHPGKRQEFFSLFSKSGFTPGMREFARKENVLLFHNESFSARGR